MLFAIKKVIACMVLPPGIFVLVLAGGGLYLLFRKNRKLGCLFLLSSCLLYAFSIGPVEDRLMVPLEDSFPYRGDARGDVIVMLGGGAYSGVPGSQGKGFLAEDALDRAVTSFQLWRRLRVPIIVSGGKVFPNRPRESEAEKSFFLDMGVPERQVLEEGQSRDTYENALFTGKVVREKGFRRAILVTSAYHMKRAVLNFRKAGMEVVPVPCGYRTNRTGYGPFDFMPNASSLHGSARALREYAGLTAFWIENSADSVVKLF